MVSTYTCTYNMYNFCMVISSLHQNRVQQHLVDSIERKLRELVKELTRCAPFQLCTMGACFSHNRQCSTDDENTSDNPKSTDTCPRITAISPLHLIPTASYAENGSISLPPDHDINLIQNQLQLSNREHYMDPQLFWNETFLEKCAKVMEYWARVVYRFPQHIALDNLIALVIKYLTEREHFALHSNWISIPDKNRTIATFSESDIQTTKTITGAFIAALNTFDGLTKCEWCLQFKTEIGDTCYFGIINDLDVGKIYNDIDGGFVWWEQGFSQDNFQGYGFQTQRDDYDEGNDFCIYLILDLKKGQLSFINNDAHFNKCQGCCKVSRHSKYRLAVAFKNTVGDATVELMSFRVF